jgi:hypothetical protein
LNKPTDVKALKAKGKLTVTLKIPDSKK